MNITPRTKLILAANLAILLAEMLVMYLLPHLSLPSPMLAALLDAIVLMAVATLTMRLVWRRTELDLELANQELSQRNKELKARDADRVLMEEMGEYMLATRDPEETYNIVARFIGRLLPGTSGGLYVLRHTRNTLEQAGAWGERHQSEPWFVPEECWAFRRGKWHEVRDQDRDLCCTHVNPRGDVAYCCLPMIANGESLGMLHMEGPATCDEFAQTANFKMDLMLSLAKHIALALANNRLQKELESQSIRDPLTGLFNRRFLDESFTKELHRAQRKPEPVGVIMLDLDHFKSVNDEYGHDAGDAVLRAVAAQLQKEVRMEDIACRLGGEEFVLIMPGISQENLEKRAAHMLCTFPELRISHNGRFLKPVTASMGLACFPQHGADAECLLRAADTALYASKHASRNCYTVAASVPSPAVVAPVEA